MNAPTRPLGALIALLAVIGTTRGDPPAPQVEKPRAVLGREGHADSVYAVAFRPDGKILASGGKDKTVMLWNLAPGKRLATLGHPGVVYAVAFSPDGKTLAVGVEDKTVRLWDVDTRKMKATLKGHTGRVLSVAFSADRKTVAAGGEDKSARLWDARTGAPKGVLTGHKNLVRFLAFSPDGKTLFTACSDHLPGASTWGASPGPQTGAGEVKVWDVATGKELRPLEELVSALRALALRLADWRLYLGGAPEAAVFRPDGKVMAWADASHHVSVFEPSTGKSRGIFLSRVNLGGSGAWPSARMARPWPAAPTAATSACGTWTAACSASASRATWR